MITQIHTLDKFVEEKNAGYLLQIMNKKISEDLKGSETNLHRYFPDSKLETAILQWIIHFFSIPDDAIHNNDFPAKEWITIRVSEVLKIELQEQNVDFFWV